MAEGADGEEEIQFLRTVSDAVCFFSCSLQLYLSSFSQQCKRISFLYSELSLYDIYKHLVCWVTFFT